MLPTLGLLLGCQLVGEVAARALALPVPGPVIGLAASRSRSAAFARARGNAQADRQRDPREPVAHVRAGGRGG